MDERDVIFLMNGVRIDTHEEIMVDAHSRAGSVYQRPMRCIRPEAIEAVRRLAAKGKSDQEISDALHGKLGSRDAILKIRVRATPPIPAGVGNNRQPRRVVV